MESLGVEVARDGDVDYGAGGDVRGEEDGWEFDLVELSVLDRDGPELDCARNGSVVTYQTFVLG